MIVWAPGTRLGPYELTAPLGAGGMGEVWKARDTRVDRVVAIKRLKAEHAERFKREARAIAALNHPHICQLYDVGPDYLVMEYVEGEILKGPVPVADALRLAVQIAEALAAAHRKGIVHRDLKPANILVTESGAKLLDFGLAQMDAPLLSGDATISVALSEPGAIVGTVAYMSPEQAQGQAVDARSDVFSFGAVLYEVLSGRRAFRGRHAVCDPLGSRQRCAAARSRRPRPSTESSAGAWPSSRAIVSSRWRTSQPRWSRRQSSPADQHPSIAVLPVRQHEPRPGRRLLQRRTGRGAHQPAGPRPQPQGHRAHVRPSPSAARNRTSAGLPRRSASRTILEGSVRRAGSRIRVTAQLINAEDGYHLWSERYDRELTDVFAIQDDIAQAIAGALQLKLVSKPARHTPSFPAYEALLKARHHCENLPAGGARPRQGILRAGDRARSGVCRAPRAVGFQLSPVDDAHGQAHAGGRAADSPGSPQSPGARPLRNRPAFPAGRGCGRARLRLAGSRSGIPVGHGQSVGASRGSLGLCRLVPEHLRPL